MLNIDLKTIPSSEHRYPTCGDYWEEGDAWHFRVSDMGDWRYELLVGIHELVEAALCKHRGVDEEWITEFDKGFEQNRDLGDESEPGDDPNAPYRSEHRFAENIERQLALALDVDWPTYDEVVLNS